MEKIIIAKVEDDSYDGKEFKKVTDTVGKVWRIKQGREGALKEKWFLLKEGEAINLTMGSYQGKPFVKDFEVITDIAEKTAIAETQAQVSDDKHRSMFVSYAKDLVIGGKIDLEQMFIWADKFCQYLKGSKIEAPPEPLESKNKPVEEESNIMASTEVKPPETGQDEVPVTTAGDLMKWALSKGKEFTPSWIRGEAGLKPLEVITTEKAQAAYKLIKEKMGWD